MANSDEEQEPTTSSPIPGKCDICANKDEFNGHNLQACKECGVRVHETCYGLVSTGGRKDPDWRCHACAAVGTNVIISKPGDGGEKTVKQEDRPAVCALCPIKTGPHAMHPLYDVGGPEGRPVVLPSAKKGAPKQLAWVHTLCAMYHSVHSGFLYGCTKEGDYEEDTESPQKSAQRDDDSESSDSDSDDDDDGKESFAGTHHFVIGGKEQGKGAEWAKKTRTNILQVRRLVCFVCNKKDNIHGVLRIPVQCSAGSKDENEQLKKRRLNPEVSCDNACHVGCAKWGLNSKGKKPAYRRVFYHPGTQDRDPKGDTFKGKPSVNCYCNKHAKEIHEKKHVEKRKRRIVEDDEE